MKPPENENKNGDAVRTGSSLNTILLWATLGSLGVIAALSLSTALQLAEMKGSMVGRQEIEAKIAEVKVSQLALEKDLTALKMALAERGITKKQ